MQTKTEFDSSAPMSTPTPTPITMLARLLAMAQRYQKEGQDRQATEMFWMLVDEHADTPQAKAAKEALLALAESYERTGNLHMARSMYERLMDLEA